MPRGMLPAGVHDLTLDQLRPLVCTNFHRQAMWFRLVSFIVLPVLLRRFSYVYVGGGYLTDAPEPRDIDVIMETKDPYGPEAFAVVERFFLAGLDNIRDIYTVDLHFWMEGAPNSLADYRTFFQYNRMEPRKEPLFSPVKGLARVNIRTPDIKEQLRRHLSLVDFAHVFTGPWT